MTQWAPGLRVAHALRSTLLADGKRRIWEMEHTRWNTEQPSPIAMRNVARALQRFRGSQARDPWHEGHAEWTERCPLRAPIMELLAEHLTFGVRVDLNMPAMGPDVANLLAEGVLDLKPETGELRANLIVTGKPPYVFRGGRPWREHCMSAAIGRREPHGERVPVCAASSDGTFVGTYYDARDAFVTTTASPSSSRPSASAAAGRGVCF